MVEFVGLLICVPLWIIAVILLGASITSGLFFVHVAVAPLLFKFSKTFRRSIIFANFVQWPFRVDYDDPSTCGIEGGRNLTVEYHSKIDNCAIRLGVWHILPKSVYERLKGSFEEGVDREELNRLLDYELAHSKRPIVMYCHGNSNSRCAKHRIEMYKFLQKMDFHTIAFDYRGYGDSTNLHPTEAGVVEDSLIVYEWLYNTVNKETLVKINDDKNKPPVFVWGHSLGTGISSNLLGNLEDLSSSLLDRSESLPLPKGLILEAPFNNLADEVAHFPLTRLVTWLPYYEWAFLTPFHHPPHAFRSDCHLRRKPHLPTLILHAKDDYIVPFAVCRKLYKSISEARKDGGATIKLHVYEKDENLGHKWICHAKDLSQVVGEFVESHR